MTKIPQVITTEAIEVAARAMHADAYPPEYWDARPDLRHIFTKRARRALEAAAPHMLAGAWGEGRKHGATYPYGERGLATDDNPYRIQA